MLIFGHIQRLWLQVSLKTKVTLAAILPLVLILGSFTLIEYNRHRTAVFINLSVLATQSSQIIEDSLRHQMLESDEKALTEILTILNRREELERVYILDLNGKVVFAPDESQIGLQLHNSHPDCQPCHSLPANERPGSVIVENEEGQRVFRSMQPIENSPECVKCHDEEDRLLGVLLTDISTAPIEEPLIADLRENIMWWLATIIVTIVVVRLVLDQFVLQRVTRLATAMNRFAPDHPYTPLTITTPDELGQLTTAFNQMAHNVKMRHEENVSLSLQLQQQSAQRGIILKQLLTAQEDERKRVARELHDELGQSLGALSIQVQLLARLLDTDNASAQEQLSQIRTMISDTTDSMYNLILALRPSALDDLGLVPALQVHAERTLKGTNIKFELDATHLNRRLPTAVETTLFRVSQEALTNIVRHAKATQVRIEFVCQNGLFTGQIIDNGQGFDATTLKDETQSGRSGWGLLGIQERIMQCNGRLQIMSSPGKGTNLQIYIPLGENSDG